ncbi:hypothetical protein JG687_00012289 [Phytophthora cactorum]|uniref:Uncharacterized protein n=1 Tax=Phytophthora cactorum TaxID=29920 RepID=A0A8T1U490_9STRA|nr:hypothetical protein JG687_00012289 [Phytophthora cactorum]
MISDDILPIDYRRYRSQTTQFNRSTQERCTVASCAPFSSPPETRKSAMDPASRLCIVLLLEMVTAANPASTRATVLLEQAHGIEVDAVSGLFRPRDREWIAKERSSHWSNMLLSSRVYFDSSMKDIFRMDSSRIVALFKAVCPGMVPKNRDAPDAIVPPKRLAISSMCVRTVQHHE